MRTKKSDECEYKGASLANIRCDLRCARVAQARRDQSAQYASAVHRKRGKQIEKDQPHIDQQKLRKKIRTFDRCLIHEQAWPYNNEQTKRDQNINKRPGDR